MRRGLPSKMSLVAPWPSVYVHLFNLSFVTHLLQIQVGWMVGAGVRGGDGGSAAPVEGQQEGEKCCYRWFVIIKKLALFVKETKKHLQFCTNCSIISYTKKKIMFKYYDGEILKRTPLFFTIPQRLQTCTDMSRNKKIT